MENKNSRCMLTARAFGNGFRKKMRMRSAGVFRHQPATEGRTEMEKKKISTEMRMEYGAAVSYLENLFEAFKAGRIEVRKKENRIILAPSSEINVEMEAKQKPEKESFSIEISWTPCAASKDEEDRVRIKAFIVGQDGKDETAATDSAPAAIRADDAAGAAAPAGEKRPPDEMKSVDVKNGK
jgi:amphi-Trp domain-containing protein